MVKSKQLSNYSPYFQTQTRLTESEYWDLRGKIVETGCLVHISMDYFDTLPESDLIVNYEQSKNRRFFTMDDEFAIVLHLHMKDTESYWKFLAQTLNNYYMTMKQGWV